MVNWYFCFIIKGIYLNFENNQNPFQIIPPNGTVITDVSNTFLNTYYVLTDICFGIPATNSSSCSGLFSSYFKEMVCVLM
jgi:hypothetical protein